ncbi:K+-transporting ATPase ATPase A chain [Saccharopolyspora erythraea NRRL 2338]|uniref:Potassium-transporting ATPase potassium-binding subunit n=4 Tax=Saccharopolyspora erythraea TaxID=1836 RepID=A4FMI7_SACEN|nr:potassium-transporting ATPase subunit KdpA [Saccharopolyspora erythraea]PFG98910.1 K+-transporting ATPase ATPase A chain [Saccharopolyspora erythraea NRRL 2338]QRK88896.1 potassium-transporting ATPase subunit KdpA [Saccharopolyspora erythraea]CAM05262.1 potassium-transporting ATPase A chain [Saccharopolyspora erythraea NRRL 2338]
MSSPLVGLVQAGLLVLAVVAVYRPFGDYMARVYTGAEHWRVERALYRAVRIDGDAPQRWTTYAAGVLGFSFVSIVLLYLLQRLQHLLPLSFGRGPVEPATAFNTAVSFVTNTNWQSYVPETTLGHTVQMAGLTVQNFLSAAVGMAVAVALVRGFTGTATNRVGNVWVDITRGVTRILLPISLAAAVVLVALGGAMSLASGIEVTGVDGHTYTIATAPIASQEAIKELGTNGGGILNANSAHPFENPSGWSNFLELFLILVIPLCLTRTFGTMVGDRRQGHVLLSVMVSILLLMTGAAWWAETHPNGPATLAAGGAMEGKEARFGLFLSTLWAVVTTGTSTGAVNSMHDSFTGLGGGVPLLNMLLGEVAPGGVGSGLYGMLVLAVIAVFLAGLMVGRTPEYLGKKLGRREITAAAVSILAMPTVVLLGAGAALALPGTLEALNNSGAHGLSEVLYAYASAGNNNGSAFAGLTATGDFFQSTLGVAMLVGRFVPVLAVLALAGALAQQQRVPATAGTLPTTGPLFAGLLGGTVVLVAALTFLPALALGPIAEALA